MSWSSSRVALGAVLLCGVALGTKAPGVAAQVPPGAPLLKNKSVRGTLESVDKSLNGLIIKTDTGERMAWRFEAAVIAEAARFKPGDPVVVIYRQVGTADKSVTALAFPGAATKPIYVNMTGRSVVLHSGPAVDGTCGKPNAGPVNESPIGSGSLTEIADACWCCAPAGESCTPANKSGLGRALLVHCSQ